MGKTDNTNGKRKAFLLMTTLLMLSSAGCAPGEISQRRAKEIVVQNLEDKYGGEFEVRSVEKQELGMSAMKDHIYAMDVYSEDLDGIFHVEIFRDGSRMNDGYEELKYGKQIEEEINSIKYEEDGWALNDLSICHFNLRDKSVSQNIEEYKRNAEKLEIVIFVDIFDGNDKNTVDSLFEFLDALQKSGYRFTVELKRNDMIDSINELSDDEFLKKEQLSQILKALE